MSSSAEAARWFSVSVDLSLVFADDGDDIDGVYVHAVHAMFMLICSFLRDPISSTSLSNHDDVGFLEGVTLLLCCDHAVASVVTLTRAECSLEDGTVARAVRKAFESSKALNCVSQSR